MNLYEAEEMQAEWNAREDYLSEAFGAEARSLAAQADAEWEEYKRLDDAAFIGPVAPPEIVAAVRAAQHAADVAENANLPF